MKFHDYRLGSSIFQAIGTHHFTMNLFSLPCLILIFCLFISACSRSDTVQNRVFYVDASGGDDTNNCLALNSACKSIQGAAKMLRGGDTLIVKAGTYYESLRFKNLRSSRKNPVLIKAEPRGSARISGMWEQAAVGKVQWQDVGDGIYSATHGPMLFGSYKHTFLFRLNSIEELRNAEAKTRSGTVKLPPYGFAFKRGKIYIRLPGNTDPNGKSILLSPPSWREPGRQSVITVDDSPGFILDGFYIEGSGTVCVNFDKNSTSAVVRNTIFQYCRYGMRLPDKSLVEWSEYTYPGFIDFAEKVRRLNNGKQKIFNLVKEYHASNWLEGGLADSYGRKGTSRYCEFRHNFMHETFDGESLGDFEYSESHHNVYFSNFDDHVEMESWAGHQSRELRLHHNLFLSAGLISHQETSLKGPQYIYRNVWYYYDDHGASSWTIIKSKAPNANGGIHYYNNLLWGVTGELFWESRHHLHFRNNLFIFKRNQNWKSATELDSKNNLLINDDDKPWLYGHHGLYLGTDPSVFNFNDRANLDFGIKSNSVVIGKGVEITGLEDIGSTTDIGPFGITDNPGMEWPRPRRTVFLQVKFTFDKP